MTLDLAELQRKHRSYFPEQLSVDYTLLGSFDNESLYAFLMHGPKDDGDVVCVDENPDELDGPPSPRLEAVSEIINSFPALIAELKEAREAAADAELNAGAIHSIREACKEIMGGNATFVDDDFARCLTTLRAKCEKMRAALAKIADPQPTFAGPQCCKDTFEDACELFSDIASKALAELDGGA
tara:strand:- start:439 stop:990 length:552 start_codon:yes stop_codon:yes gene_type:complete